MERYFEKKSMRGAQASWHGILAVVCWSLALFPGWAGAGGDPGKETIGSLKAELIFATNKDVSVLGRSAKRLTDKEQARMEAAMRQKFKEYRKLGVDRKPILRGYENWTAPMSGSEEIMVSFEPKGRIGKDALRLDLELWQSKQKVLKTDPILRKGKLICILGPRWRGGRLIIVLELIDLLEE